jgi:hypothetical protein
MRFSDYVRSRTTAPSIAGKVVPMVDNTAGGAVFKTQGEDLAGEAANSTIQTLAFNASISMNLVNGKWAKLTLTGNVTSFSIIGLSPCAQGKIIVTQGGTGVYTINWGSAILPPGGMQLNEGVAAITVVDYIYDGTRLILSTAQSSVTVAKKHTLTLASVDGFKLIDAGTLVQHISIIPSGELASLKIGTTNGGEEISTDQAYSASVIDIPVGQTFSAATTIYFTGITSPTTIFIYYA